MSFPCRDRHLTRSKKMKDLTVFRVKEIKRIASDDREKKKSISLQENGVNQYRELSHPEKLFGN